MDAGDNAGPLERAWRCCGFRILENEGWELPEVVEAPDKVTVLMLPAAWAGHAELREIACGYGVGSLFLTRYGLLMLIRGILAWPRLVEQMGVRDREPAAD